MVGWRQQQKSKQVNRHSLNKKLKNLSKRVTFELIVKSLHCIERDYFMKYIFFFFFFLLFFFSQQKCKEFEQGSILSRKKKNHK